jgi:hypothetical protein
LTCEQAGDDDCDGGAGDDRLCGARVGDRVEAKFDAQGIAVKIKAVAE